MTFMTCEAYIITTRNTSQNEFVINSYRGCIALNVRHAQPSPEKFIERGEENNICFLFPVLRNISLCADSNSVGKKLGHDVFAAV